ncbi:class III extradiol ring-cleavage dioxygenase [Paenibacillus sp. UNC499MF]|uniref:DODA-type extradiol aromatic ring-opening family dioxygenase n=1 Tax=Paenibacillus sp. UNC499MF TaxID=1502751 RepID=UPI00089F8644|nr:class III extradiol ring-cleavage dioxygenase [Paenibacillus sp. UNC499MF]SEF64531.1 Aromatic ring-opening dioxygenase, catalytic subunit, LigB family [Paenibacillus sp. UNC499MF]
MIPSLFLAHGSPALAIQDTKYTAFLRELGQQWKPKAIVIFTAHWESEVLTLTSTDGAYETIYDFYGFPDELYQITYPAKGSAGLASRLEGMFREKGIETGTDSGRGLDHGSWTLLYKMFPEADIPVIQLSVNPHLPPENQILIGEALRGLGEEDILVIGSGVTVHNLRMVNWGQEEPEPWAVEFDDWLIERTLTRDTDSLVRYETLAPHSRMAVPRAEHFVPFFLALGSGQEEAAPRVIYRDYEFGTLSYLCLQF